MTVELLSRKGVRKKEFVDARATLPDLAHLFRGAEQCSYSAAVAVFLILILLLCRLPHRSPFFATLTRTHTLTPFSAKVP